MITSLLTKSICFTNFVIVLNDTPFLPHHSTKRAIWIAHTHTGDNKQCYPPLFGYDAILNVLEPLPLPPKTARQAEKQYGISVNAGFLLREPYDICNEGYAYLAFAMGGNGKENHCYYLGLSSTKQAHFDLPDRF